MRSTSIFCVALLGLGLGGCVPSQPHVTAPELNPAFDAEIRLSQPSPTDPRCWHRQTRPALFETKTEQVMVSPETRDAKGAVLRPATFRSESFQRELRPRQTIWFRVPCERDIARADTFTASLQRALKARGLYGGAITGEMNDETAHASRRYQLANGLDSPVLSHAAAQALGLIAKY